MEKSTSTGSPTFLTWPSVSVAAVNKHCSIARSCRLTLANRLSASKTFHDFKILGSDLGTKSSSHLSFKQSSEWGVIGNYCYSALMQYYKMQ